MRCPLVGKALGQPHDQVLLGRALGSSFTVRRLLEPACAQRCPPFLEMGILEPFAEPLRPFGASSYSWMIDRLNLKVMVLRAERLARGPFSEDSWSCRRVPPVQAVRFLLVWMWTSHGFPRALSHDSRSRSGL